MAHTPGPWTYNYSTRRGISDEWYIFGNEQSGSPALAAVTPDEDVGLIGATVEANARLITAAPELLRVARGVMALLGESPRKKGRGVQVTELYEAAYDAVARAEGRS